jgi:hypothetical protein
MTCWNRSRDSGDDGRVAQTLEATQMAVKPSALFLGSSVLACWRRQYSFEFSEPA